MLNYFWKKNRQRGFTLIELVVVLAILGILIALAVPRYLGARRSALISEGDNTIQEMKTMAWAYYQQYGTWVGLTAGLGAAGTNFHATVGFAEPGSGCWTYGLDAAGAAATIVLIASGLGTSGPAKCRPLGADTASEITLTFLGDGSSTRAQSLP